MTKKELNKLRQKLNPNDFYMAETIVLTEEIKCHKCKKYIGATNIKVEYMICADCTLTIPIRIPPHK